MRRRTFMAGLGSAAAWPVVIHAQQTALQVRRVGVLMNNSTNDADAVRHEAIFAKALIPSCRWNEHARSMFRTHDDGPPRRSAQLASQGQAEVESQEIDHPAL
jgi:hypothetical protein